jgi:periplasmic copper chaperone A
MALLLPSAALAHFEVKPRRGDPNDARAFTFSIENEQSNAATVRFDVQLPTGVEFLGARSLGGWKLVRAASRGGPRTISFRARRPLGPGEAEHEFVVSLRLPRTPGATLSFKGVQTYDNGEKVRWIGPPGSEEPAPTVRVSTRNVTDKAITGTTSVTGATGTDTTAPASEDEDDDGGISGWLIAILVLGGVALIGGGAYLFTRANRRES